MKTSVIAPLGLSPPVVTEFIQYLDLAESSLPDYLFLMTTNDKEVMEGAELIKTAMSLKYRKCRVNTISLPFPDLDRQERVWEFTRLAGKLLVDQRLKYNVRRVHVLISGGRKIMGIQLAMLCQIFPTSGVYHVVARDVRVASERLEAIRGLISELAKDSDKEDFYREHSEEFDPVMWPPMSEYSVVKLPILPYPQEVLERLVRVLSSPRTRRKEAAVPEELLVMLWEGGLLQVVEGWIIPTEIGRELGEALGSVLG